MTAPRAAGTGAGDFDQRMTARLQEARKLHTSCRDIRVRAAAMHKQSAEERGRAEAEMMDRFGTTDRGELRERVAADRAQAESLVSDYEAQVKAVADALRELGEQP